MVRGNSPHTVHINLYINLLCCIPLLQSNLKSWKLFQYKSVADTQNEWIFFWFFLYIFSFAQRLSILLRICCFDALIFHCSYFLNYTYVGVYVWIALRAFAYGFREMGAQIFRYFRANNIINSKALPSSYGNGIVQMETTQIVLRLSREMERKQNGRAATESPESLGGVGSKRYFTTRYMYVY